MVHVQIMTFSRRTGEKAEKWSFLVSKCDTAVSSGGRYKSPVSVYIFGLLSAGSCPV